MMAFRGKTSLYRLPRATSLAAFTIVELLVVIAIIAILVAILLPSLSGARAAARQSVELGSVQQLNVAAALYINQNRDMVLPGYPPRAWVDGPVIVTDASGRRLFGEVAQRYPWRIAPLLDYNFKGLYQSTPLLDELRRGSEQFASFGIDGPYLMSLYPSLGVNAAFVGGSVASLGFNAANLSLFGQFYVTRPDQVRRPDRLIVWASARDGVATWAPQIGRPEGFFRVEAPWFSGRNWAQTYDPAAVSPGLNSGFVSLRHRGKAVVGLFDGHAEALDWDALQDMRRWSNQATRPDWTLTPRTP